MDSTSARGVDSNMTNEHAWNLTDLAGVPKNGVRVFTTFACGGGSSMGYKRAGCEVVAANDIDPEMQWHYVNNLHPPAYFLCPIRDLIGSEATKPYQGIDILDGSPPCSTFSMAGNREADWGKDKHFREGQVKQVLSDLFFDFLDLAEWLRPKVIIAENVKGMLIGKAKGYCKLVMQRMRALGYRPQAFLINAADCGVPQRRERVFFCAVREDVSDVRLTINPKHRWVSAAEACEDVQVLTKQEVNETKPIGVTQKAWKETRPGSDFSEWFIRHEGRHSFFQHVRLASNTPCPTLSTNPCLYNHWSIMRHLTCREFKRLGSFPDDYTAKTMSIGKYMVGMSVPPKMMECVARQVCRQWLGVQP